MAYGIKLNMALTQDDEGVSGGLHIVDSDGMDISSESDGSNMMEVVTHLACDAAGLVKESMEPTPQSIIDTLMKDFLHAAADPWVSNVKNDAVVDAWKNLHVKNDVVMDASDLWGLHTKSEDCKESCECDRDCECECDHCVTSAPVPFSAADIHEVSEANVEDDELTTDDYIEMFADVIKEEAYEGNFEACVYSELFEDKEEIPAAVDDAIEHYLAADFSLRCESSKLADGLVYLEYFLCW